MVQLMLATRNPGKVAELRELLALYLDLTDLTLMTPGDWPTELPEVAENGETFAENALLKARSLASATGLPAVADDSGLCVDALGGRPGLYSARWAGAEATDTDRNEKLLVELRGVPAARRTAQFVCAMVLALPDGMHCEADGTHCEAVGVCDGLILEEPRGTHGFGYDPLFLLPEFGRTMAELTAAEKNQVSHRAKALAGLAPYWHLLDWHLLAKSV